MLEAFINTKYAKPDKTIKQHTDDLLARLELLKKLGYLNEDRIYELVKLACIYHDVGKINNEFQKRVTSSKKIRFNPKKEVSHNILSFYFIDKNQFEKEDDYLIVAHAVLNHHDYVDVLKAIDKKQELIQKLISEYNPFLINYSTCSKIATKAVDKDAIKVKGYLQKCDYAASGDYTIEYENYFLEASMSNLLDKWKVKNKAVCWNEMQKYCMENKDKNIIVIAQTGMGKTEAGLHWIGNEKGFFVLPIRAAINAIYNRVVYDVMGFDKDDINSEYNKSLKLDEKISILHSNSLEYYADFYKSYTIDLKEDDKEYLDIVKYQKIGKNLSLPLNISTMDQLFDFVYKYNGFEIKLTTLSYSKIVIDEIQMYGPDLLAYLIYGLEQIVNQGGKVAILTATLAPFIRKLLCRNIDFEFNEEPFIDDSIRHNLKVIQSYINEDDIIDLYESNKALNKGNKILVVCNTVKKAQEIYRNLKESIPNEEINILHSKFIKKDRHEKELKIIEFGKTYDEQNNIDIKNGIWVCTSIVEASLDIDFDYLFTELQDLSSLFQRLGRCNRKGVKDVEAANCYIYTEIDENLITKENDKNIFIDETIFNLSKEAVCQLDGKISEKQKIDLIERYMTMENLKRSNYIRKYNETYDFIKDILLYEFRPDDIHLRNILTVDIIPNKVYELNKGLIDENLEKLRENNLSMLDKIKIIQEIEALTVSVSPWHLREYREALSQSKAVTYSSVRLNNYQIYPVIECEYEDYGYMKKNFNETIIREVNFI